jgi:uncharacterized protein
VPRAFTRLAFTDAVRREQQLRGTREVCAALDAREPANDVLAPRAVAFIEAVDTAFIATASSEGWPYVQHRGGPKGFIRVLDDTTIAFDGYDGNQQFITLGNLRENPRIAMFLMDFERRARLKLWGTASIVERGLSAEDHNAAAQAARHIAVRIAAWDFNCSKYIAARIAVER